MQPRIEIHHEGPASLLTAEQWVPRPVEEVFPFFADPCNLERITPPFLNFRVLSMDTPTIREGTLLRYRIRLHGLPIGWTTLIREWNPPHSFRDFQLRGPYTLWDHTHTFEARDGGTLLRDQVRYRTLLDPLRRTPLLSWVDRDVESIFRHRQSVIAGIFTRPSATATPATEPAASSRV